MNGQICDLENCIKRLRGPIGYYPFTYSLFFFFFSSFGNESRPFVSTSAAGIVYLLLLG